MSTDEYLHIIESTNQNSEIHNHPTFPKEDSQSTKQTRTTVTPLYNPIPACETCTSRARSAWDRANGSHRAEAFCSLCTPSIRSTHRGRPTLGSHSMSKSACLGISLFDTVPNKQDVSTNKTGKKKAKKKWCKQNQGSTSNAMRQARNADGF